MAFSLERLSVVVNNAKSGQVPSMWLYYNSGADTVTDANYFVCDALTVGDQIDVLANGFGTVTRYRVSAISAGKATVVGTSSIVSNPNGVQALSGAGAVDIITGTTLLTTPAGATALTLLDGYVGQRKVIKLAVAGGGTATLTPTNLMDGSTIAFTEAYDTVELVFAGTEWCIVSNIACTVA